MSRVLIALAVLFASNSFAAVPRTFVSAVTGSDTNACTRQLPCRNFAAAVAATSAGGEVVVLDSGGYGPVTISSSVALVAPAGVHAAVTGFTGTTILIAAAPGDDVILRGLYVNGIGADGGIAFITGRSLHVESCSINGFVFAGLGAYADQASVFVTDTNASFNGSGFTGYGFYFNGTTFPVTASLDHVRADGNANGIGANVKADVTVSNSTISGSTLAGIYGPHPDAAPTVINLDRCVITHNATGVGSAGLVRLARTAVMENATGMSILSGGTAESFGDNHFAGNQFGTTTFTTTIPLQ